MLVLKFSGLLPWGWYLSSSRFGMEHRYGSNWDQIWSFSNSGNPGNQGNHGNHGNLQVAAMKNKIKLRTSCGAP